MQVAVTLPRGRKRKGEPAETPQTTKARRTTSASTPRTPAWLSPHIEHLRGSGRVAGEVWTELMDVWIAHEAEGASDKYSEVCSFSVAVLPRDHL